VINNGSCLYMTWPPCAITTCVKATQQSYVNAFLAAAPSKAVLVDMWSRIEAVGGEEGLTSASTGYYNADGIHPALIGNLDIGNFLFKVISPHLA